MQFPVIMIILIILGLFGGTVVDTGPDASDVDDSDIIISTPSGGLIRSNAERNRGTGSQQPTTPPPPSIEQPARSPEPTPEPPEPPEPREIPPVITTWAAQNIETDRALLRGELNFPEAEYRGRLFFMYSTSQSAVRAASPATNQTEVSSRASRSGQYSQTLRGLNDDTTYYYRLCFEAAVRQCGNTVAFTTVEDAYRYSSYRAPSVSTDRAEDIGANEATVGASYRRNDADIVTAFLVYGESRTAVGEIDDRYDEYNDIREQGDSLQKERVARSLESTGEFVEVIDDLEKDTEYYYTFCIAYDDDVAQGISCGYARSFETKERDRNDPRIGDVTVNVAGTLVQMSASVTMGDYLDGHVFVVYGNNIDRVRAVENTSTFSRISQSADALQKLSIDIDFDGNEQVFASTRDLVPDVHYYRFCVEYEKEDDYGRERFVLTCSDLRSFTIESS